MRRMPEALEPAEHRACERVTGKAREIESVTVAPVQWREREPLTERRRREARASSYWRGTVSAPL